MIASRLLTVAALIACASASSATIVGARAQQAPRSINPLATLEESSLSGFVDKPLFEPSRHRPVIVPPLVYIPPPPQPVVEPPPPLRLLGLVEGTHSLAAIVRRSDTGRTEMLHPGDHVGGWVVELMPTTMRVMNGDRAFDYSLFGGGPTQGPVAVPPPPSFVAPTVVARDPTLAGRR